MSAGWELWCLLAKVSSLQGDPGRLEPGRWMHQLWLRENLQPE